MASNWMNDIQELIEAVSERLNLRVMSRSVIGGAGIGLVSAGLGMFFGPLGLVAGAAVGGLAAAWINADEEKSLIDVLKELTSELKEKLYSGVTGLLNGWRWPSLDDLLNKVMENEKLLNNITDFIRMFFAPLGMVVLPRLL